MEKSITVILWGPEDTIGQGVEMLLNAQKGWEIIRINQKQGIDLLVREAERVKPDVIILYQSDCASEALLPTKLLDQNKEVRVITIHLEDCDLEVYQKKRVCVKEVGDLLEAVEGSKRHIRASEKETSDDCS